MTMNRVEYRVESMADMLDTLYRSESRRILATLIRLLGDFDLGRVCKVKATGVWRR